MRNLVQGSYTSTALIYPSEYITRLIIRLGTGLLDEKVRMTSIFAE